MTGVEEKARTAAAPARVHFPRFGWTGAIFTAGLAVICGLAARAGNVPNRLFGHDTFFLLDNAYRLLQGQVPHRDFSSAWGPVIYCVEAVGLLLSRLQPAGLGYANAVFGGLIGIWAYRIGRGRLLPGNACLLGLFAALLITGPFSLGWGAYNFSHAMTYNRYGFALLGILVVECIPHVLNAELDERLAARGGFSSGAAFAALVFLKISYGVFAFPFILISLAFSNRRRPRVLALGAGFGLVTLAALCILRFDVADMVRDLLMAAHSRNKSWHPGDIMRLAFGEPMECVPVLLLAVAVWRERAERLADTGLLLRAGLIALLTLFTGGVLISTNHQLSTLPLNGFAAIALANYALVPFRRGSRAALDLLEPRGFVAVFLMLASVAPLAAANAFSLIGAVVAEGRPPAPSVVRLESGRGAAMLFETPPLVMTTETSGPEYATVLNDGMALLRRHTGSSDGVLVIDMVNPFNYLLGRPSPRGGMASAAYNYIFSGAAHPTPDRFFGDGKYVLERKYSRAAGDYVIEAFHIDGIRKVYGAELHKRFRLIEETTHWVLYGPKPLD